MDNVTSLGLNRTGTQSSPLTASSMQSYADARPPTAVGRDGGIAQLRSDYVHDAERVGSVPLPATLAGAINTGADKLIGKRPEVLVDKLGERLAFERGGVRLYDALLHKATAHDADGEALPFALDDLRHHRGEELEHMHMLVSALESIGADPTAQTPSADVAGVAASGLMQVVSDPRTTIAQSLTALLTAELSDHASWELLVELAAQAGHERLVEPFRYALQQELEHVERVRGWLTELVVGEAA
jgi:rubrerythrin